MVSEKRCFVCCFPTRENQGITNATLKSKFSNYSHSKINVCPKSPHIKHSWKQIHDQLTFTPIIKPVDNPKFVCKQFYVKMLLKKLCISKNEPTKITETYKYSQQIKSKSVLSLEETNKCLQTIYRLPKLHKNPTWSIIQISNSFFSFFIKTFIKITGKFYSYRCLFFRN